MQPYKVTANSSEVVRVRCLAKRHLDTLLSGVSGPWGVRWPPEGLVRWFASCWPPVVDGCCHKWGRSSLKENQAKKMQAYYDYLKQMIIIEQLGRWVRSQIPKRHITCLNVIRVHLNAKTSILCLV